MNQNHSISNSNLQTASQISDSSQTSQLKTTLGNNPQASEIKQEDVMRISQNEYNSQRKINYLFNRLKSGKTTTLTAYGSAIQNAIWFATLARTNMPGVIQECSIIDLKKRKASSIQGIQIILSVLQSEAAKLQEPCPDPDPQQVKSESARQTPNRQRKQTQQQSADQQDHKQVTFKIPEETKVVENNSQRKSNLKAVDLKKALISDVSVQTQEDQPSDAVNQSKKQSKSSRQYRKKAKNQSSEVTNENALPQTESLKAAVQEELKQTKTESVATEADIKSILKASGLLKQESQKEENRLKKSQQSYSETKTEQMKAQQRSDFSVYHGRSMGRFMYPPQPFYHRGYQMQNYRHGYQHQNYKEFVKPAFNQRTREIESAHSSTSHGGQNRDEAQKFTGGSNGRYQKKTAF